MQNFKFEYKVCDWKSIFMLHWIINPGLVINELFLGQRMPKIMLIKKDSIKPLSERSFIPCPHCGTIHPSLEWSSQNKTALGNWFGLYCNHCGKVIPCLRNCTSFIIIIFTFPIWLWFKSNLEKKWLILQKEKFSKPLKLLSPKYNIWLQAINFGICYYILIIITKFLIFHDHLNWKKLIGNLIGAIVIGFISASLIKEMYVKRPTIKHSSNK